MEAAPLWFDAEDFVAETAPGLHLDIVRLEPCEAERFAHGLSLHVGELLAGCSLNWVVLERERLLLIWLRAQLRWLEHCAAGQEWDAALAAGAAVLRQDPLRESVHRRMIELHIASGNPCAAYRQFKACAEVLQRELGIEPAEPTRAALEGRSELLNPRSRGTANRLAAPA